MAEPISFPHVNRTWWGPGDMGDLPVHQDETANVSCWKLTEQELEEVAATGVIWLTVWGGHPPVNVTGHDPFTEAT